MMDGCGYGGPAFGLMMGIGSIFWIALLVLVIVAIIRLWPKKPEDSALEVLRRRYAQGEIDKAEYDQKTNDLRR